MKKIEALQNIRYEVATHGKITKKAMQLYCEHRIAYKIFMDYVDQGRRYFKGQLNKNEP